MRASFDLSTHVAGKLDEIAAERGVSRAQMIRRLLRCDVAAYQLATLAAERAKEKQEKLGEPLDEEEPAVVAFPSESKRNLRLWKKLRADVERAAEAAGVTTPPEGGAA